MQLTDSDIREEAAELVKELRYWADDADLPACERALRNAARFIEGVTLAPAAEPVGQVVKMPGSTGFTMAVFGAEQVPVGTSLYAAPPAPVAEGYPTHRHKKRGTAYVLIGIGKMQADWLKDIGTISNPDLVSVDDDEVAIYRSVEDGSLWVRPREEFEDRFEVLPAAPAPVTDAEAKRHAIELEQLIASPASSKHYSVDEE